MKTFTSNSLEETAKIASDWLVELSNSRAHSDEATVVGLSGHLGAGKTAFVKEVAKILGIDEEVTSPTFIIMKIYELIVDSGQLSVPWKRLIHIDAYRLERREELEGLNWESLVADKNNLILMEWPENVGIIRENCSVYIKFDIQEGRRLISIE